MARSGKVKVVKTADKPNRLAKLNLAKPGQDEVKSAPAKAGRSDELKQLKDQLLRVGADFENFRKRSEEQSTVAADVARTAVVLELLPVIDNFERAAKHVPADISKSDWYQGFQGIKQQFTKVLESLGIKRIDSIGQRFDPNRHEAVEHEPSDEYDEGVVSEEFEAGYLLGDQVIRPAKVKVSKAKEK
jgi:molecular chaperone GrpE